MNLWTDVMLFVGKLHSARLFQIDSELELEQRDAGHTRIKTELDKIGTKKQEVE